MIRLPNIFENYRRQLQRMTVVANRQRDLHYVLQDSRILRIGKLQQHVSDFLARFWGDAFEKDAWPPQWEAHKSFTCRSNAWRIFEVSGFPERLQPHLMRYVLEEVSEIGAATSNKLQCSFGLDPH